MRGIHAAARSEPRSLVTQPRLPQLRASPRQCRSRVIGTGAYVGLSNGLSSPVNHAGTRRPLDASVSPQRSCRQGQVQPLRDHFVVRALRSAPGTVPVRHRSALSLISQTAVSGLSRLGIRSCVSTAFSAGRQARCARALSTGQRAPSPIICRSSPTSKLAELCGGSFSRRSAHLTCENSGARLRRAPSRNRRRDSAPARSQPACRPRGRPHRVGCG